MSGFKLSARFLRSSILLWLLLFRLVMARDCYLQTSFKAVNGFFALVVFLIKAIFKCKKIDDKLFQQIIKHHDDDLCVDTMTFFPELLSYLT